MFPATPTTGQPALTGIGFSTPGDRRPSESGPDLLADGILVWPQPPCGCLIHNDGPRRIGPVARGNVTPIHERHAKHPQITGAYDAILNERRRLSRFSWATLHIEKSAVGHAQKRPETHRRRAGHAGECVQPAKDFL